MEPQKVVSREEWLGARLALLAREKELTRANDALSRERQALPWVRIEKNYVFDGPEGKVTLADLFGDRSQLIVNHFMMGPGWKEGCVGCSFGADHVDAALVHLRQRDVAFVSVSRAPLAEITVFQKRMGWGFDWVSSYGSDFNYDFGVSFHAEDVARGRIFYNYAWRDIPMEEMPGFSIFIKNDAGEIFHTYSSFARGGDTLIGTYVLLDMLPKGRDEHGAGMSWVRHHDRYGAGGRTLPNGRYEPAEADASCCAAPVNG